jgi:excisionase family DNA binding protein
MTSDLFSKHTTLTIEQVAVHYGKSRRTIERYVRAGVLRPYRFGKNLQFDLEELPRELILVNCETKTP